MTAVSDFCVRIAHPPDGDVAGWAGRTVAIGLVRAAMDPAQSQGLDVRQAPREADAATRALRVICLAGNNSFKHAVNRGTTTTAKL